MPPPRLLPSASTVIERLRVRASDYAVLRKELAARPPARHLLDEVAQWPDGLREALVPFTGPRIQLPSKRHSPGRTIAMER
jgi:hypothetical protein